MAAQASWIGDTPIVNHVVSEIEGAALVNVRLAWPARVFCKPWAPNAPSITPRKPSKAAACIACLLVIRPL